MRRRCWKKKEEGRKMNQLSVDVIHVHLLPFLSPLELVRFRYTSRAAWKMVDRYLCAIGLSKPQLEEWVCPRCGSWIHRHSLETYDEFFDVFCPFERQRRWTWIRQHLRVPSRRMSLLCEDCEYEEVEWEDYPTMPYRGDRKYSFVYADGFILLFHWVNESMMEWNEFRAVVPVKG